MSAFVAGFLAAVAVLFAVLWVATLWLITRAFTATVREFTTLADRVLAAVLAALGIRTAPENLRPAPISKPVPVPAVAPPAKPDRFDACMAFVWPEEGGFSNDPQDHGGPTNLGVTEEDLAQVGMPHTIGDIKALTKPIAASRIYRPLYWNAMHCDELPPGVDLEVFDLGINAGIHEAAKLLQRAVGATQDGVIGPLTIAAVKTKQPLDIIATFNTERTTFYKGLKQFDRFGRDWLKRTADCYAASTKMAQEAAAPAPAAH